MEFSKERRGVLKALLGLAAIPVVGAGSARAQISDFENREIDTVSDIHEGLRLGGAAMWLRGFTHDGEGIDVGYEKIMYLNACDTNTGVSFQRFFEQAAEELQDVQDINGGMSFMIYAKDPSSGNIRLFHSANANNLNLVEGISRRSGVHRRLNALAVQNRCLQAGIDADQPAQQA